MKRTWNTYNYYAWLPSVLPQQACQPEKSPRLFVFLAYIQCSADHVLHYPSDQYFKISAPCYKTHIVHNYFILYNSCITKNML